jgi:molecular chaperone HtpG
MSTSTEWQRIKKKFYFFSEKAGSPSRQGPYLEALKARSLEVLLLTEPVDEYVMQSVREYKEKKIISADSDELKLGKTRPGTGR